jgi:UDP-MurNAc hydroxylase
MSTVPCLSFEFIGNACGIFTGKEGTRVLCDPWIENGVFDGSWYHYPPLKTTPSDVHEVDALYISHLHPDHFDERYFDFRRDIPIIVLEHGYNFLKKKLMQMGYSNLILIKDGETKIFNEFSITLVAPFSLNNFHETTIGNLIDSAMVIECDGIKAFNANDNTPTPEVSSTLRQRFGCIDLAMINYNAAGPYPASFVNLSEKEKVHEHTRIIARNILYMHNIVEALQPRMVLPFAGAYILGGHLSYLNDYLGTTTWDVCAAELNKIGLTVTKTICLRENDILDIGSGEPNRPYVALDMEHLRNYITKIAKDKYPYEKDEEPDIRQLKTDLELASNRMQKRMAQIGISSKSYISIALNDMLVQIYPVFKEDRSVFQAPRLDCVLDLRLLRRILDRTSHWNNAEIGCHIEFKRDPNNYEPDLHTALQFLHL